MRPFLWQPPILPSAQEQAVLKLIKRAKLFVFLRHQRHLIFDPALQEELAQAYADTNRGQPPIAPAQLALALILQAYTGVSDDEVIEATLMDRRWQLVLDCLDCSVPPFSKATLINFRQRVLAHDLDRLLIERSVAVASSQGGFGPRQLRAALDSSPLWGAGRVEDSYNLLGHALDKALRVYATAQGREPVALYEQAGATLLDHSSLKAALDCNWDDPAARAAALPQVLQVFSAVTSWLTQQTVTAEPLTQQLVTSQLQVAAQVVSQDVVYDAQAQPSLRQGVAKERRISVEDDEMRHGRKSRSLRFDGYKRHVLYDLDLGLVRAVGLTAANQPEASVSDEISADLLGQAVQLTELHIDRGYLSSKLVRNRPPELTVYCKAWRVHNGERFAKTSFRLDWGQGLLTCPNQVQMPFAEGERVQFPAEVCGACPLRAQCTSSERGRSVSIHPDERLLVELRERQLSSSGRAELRQRVAVEHSLAHVGQWQGRRARYIGKRKNLADLRRVAVVHNLHVLMRQAGPLPAA